MKSESIVLIGMAGVGKSTLGIALSKSLGFGFIDLDDYILRKDGKTVQEVIDSEGEAAFLKLEKRRMYEIDFPHKVVAPGGSIIYHPDLMEYLKQHTTLVYLEDSLENIEARLTNVSVRGIVGLKNKTIKQIYDERKPLYSQYADIIINYQEKSEDQLTIEILGHFSALKKGA